MKKLLLLVFIVSLFFVSCESAKHSSSVPAAYVTPDYSLTYHPYDPYYDVYYDGITPTGYYDSSGYTEVDNSGNVTTHGYDGSTRTYLNDGSYYYQDNLGNNSYHQDGWSTSSN